MKDRDRKDHLNVYLTDLALGPLGFLERKELILLRVVVAPNHSDSFKLLHAQLWGVKEIPDPILLGPTRQAIGFY